MDSLIFYSIIYLYIALVSQTSHCNDEPPFPYMCNAPNYNFTKGSQVDTNIGSALMSLQQPSFRGGGDYRTSVAGDGNNTIHAMLQCRGASTAKQCSDCAKNASKAIREKCQLLLGARVWLEYCYLQWENNDFIGNPDFWLKYPSNYDPAQAPNAKSFNTLVGSLISNLSQHATTNSSSNLYAAGQISLPRNQSAKNIYGLVQCWKDVTVKDCKECLTLASQNLTQRFAGKVGGRVYLGSCIALYETYRFFQPSLNSTDVQLPSSPPPVSSGNSSSSKSKMAVLLSVIGSFVFLSILLLSMFILFRRRRMRRENTHFLRRENSDFSQEIIERQLMFSLQSLSLATNNFNDNHKLSEGGFGLVYKGTLPNGREIAVKRLPQGFLQAKKDFLNEIKLLPQIRHRNLVNLLGCCIESSERMLVYEYVPNKSLNKVIFDVDIKGNLDWQTRYNIITGIARGLQYLHEESKIIHGNIKPSNILLDDKFNPKIEDFCLAKIFLGDDSHMESEIIAGTYGYLAPEYMRRGQLSIKVDVYSFGVLLLEITSGKSYNETKPNNASSETESNRSSTEISEDLLQQNNASSETESNRSSTEISEDLLQQACRAYHEGNVMDFIDETIKGEYIEEQVIRCIHIALLCIQTDPSKRPTMSTVVLMLSSSSSLPSATMPAIGNIIIGYESIIEN